MEALTIILGALTALFAGLNIYQLINFRSMKQKFKAEAEKDKAEADADKQSALEKRLAAVEKLYEEQGKVVDELRSEILQLKKDKFDSANKMIQLEDENKSLRDRVDQLGKEVEAYKVVCKQ